MIHADCLARICCIPLGLHDAGLTLCEIFKPGDTGTPPLPVESCGSALSAEDEAESTAVDDVFHLQEALRIIDADERVRANRFLKVADRDRYILAHGLLRKILAAQLGTAPETLRFQKTLHGKPELACPHAQLKFNLSHSGSHIAVATADRDVGVDVEEIRDGLDFVQITRRFFVEEEQDYVLCADQAGVRERFYYIWVRKEAMLKAAGIGLSDIAKTAVLADGVEMNLANGQTARYSIRTICSKPDLALAVAIRD